MRICIKKLRMRSGRKSHSNYKYNLKNRHLYYEMPIFVTLEDTVCIGLTNLSYGKKLCINHWLKFTLLYDILI